MTVTDLHIMHSELWCHFLACYHTFLPSLHFVRHSHPSLYAGLYFAVVAVHGGFSPQPRRMWQISWPPTFKFYRWKRKIGSKIRLWLCERKFPFRAPTLCHRCKKATLLTYLLTPWSRALLEKLTGFAANQEIPHILWNPKVHCRTHKRPSPVPILSQHHFSLPLTYSESTLTITHKWNLRFWGNMIPLC